MTQATFTRQLGALVCGGGLILTTAAIGSGAEGAGRLGRMSAPARAPVVTVASNSKDAEASQVERAIARAVATLRAKSVHGGFPAYISLDGGTNYGKTFKVPLDASRILPGPMGTSSFGEEFLRIYRATGNAEYLRAARDAGLALAWAQNGRGGWWYNVDMSGFRRDLKGAPRPMDPIALDDYGVTQTTVLFLIDLDNEMNASWLTETIERGLQSVMDSQYEVGAWPMTWPARRGAKPSSYYYGTDWVTTASIEVLLKAYEVYGDQRYLDAANRGGAFMLESILPGPGTAWAEQYDFDMNPTQGRPWEQPSMSAAATHRNIMTLIRLAEVTKREDYLQVAFDAADWLKSVQLPDGLWSRNYEIGTGRPVYFDRYGEKYYDWRDIPLDKVEPGAVAQNQLFGVPIAYHSPWQIPQVLEQIDNIRKFGLGVDPPDPSAGKVPPLRSMERTRAAKWVKTKRLVDAAARDGGWVSRSSRGRYFDWAQFRNALGQLLDFLDYDAKYQQRLAAGR